MQERLEREYKSDRLSKTRNSYTTDSVPYDKYDTPFQPQTHHGVRIDIWTHFMRGCIIDYVY